MAKLRVKLYLCAGQWLGFEVSGHAGYAQAGSDIVCSAVSALAQAAAMGLEEHAKALDGLKIEDGYLRLRLKKGLPHDGEVAATAIMETLRMGLEGIREEFPENIEISVMEEQP